MSSTKYPISAGPTNVGIYNSSTAQWSWWRLLNFGMIWAWSVGEIEFQCRFPRSVLSKRVGIEVSSRRITMEFEWQYDKFGGKRGVPQGKAECLLWCARWARGVVMVMEECRMKLRGANPGQGAPMGIEKCICSGAALPGWEAPKGEVAKEAGMK